MELLRDVSSVGRTPALQAENSSSNLLRSIQHFGNVSIVVNYTYLHGMCEAGPTPALSPKHSVVVQLVEHPAVNRVARGSSPRNRAKLG